MGGLPGLDRALAAGSYEPQCDLGGGRESVARVLCGGQITNQYVSWADQVFGQNWKAYPPIKEDMDTDIRVWFPWKQAPPTHTDMRDELWECISEISIMFEDMGVK